jgi:hypothetical protein
MKKEESEKRNKNEVQEEEKQGVKNRKPRGLLQAVMLLRSVGTWFESRSGHRLLLLGLSVVFLSPYRPLLLSIFSQAIIHESSYNSTLHPELLTKTKLNSVAWVDEKSIPTERPPLVGEVSANFCE